MRKIQNLEEAPTEILDQGAQYFGRYDLWKSVFLKAPEIHLKEVTVGKLS